MKGKEETNIDLKRKNKGPYLNIFDQMGLKMSETFCAAFSAFEGHALIQKTCG